MYKIDIHNYEAYLLDFSEGNLTDELQMELELFLIQHPELEINLDELSLVTLENEAASFSNKNSLKKSETDLISETQFIAYIEHQLSEKERLQLEKSCALNPNLSKELELYANTLASPDTSVVFENKRSLKRKPKVIWFNFSVTQYAAAACVVFLIGLFMLWPKTSTNSDSSTLANKTNVANTSIASQNNNSIKPIANNNLMASEDPNAFKGQNISSVSKNQKVLLTNHTLTNENNTLTIKDTLHPIINNSPVIELPKNEALIALNVTPVIKSHPQAIVQVITENEEEVVANVEKKKKGLWVLASRALKNLNHAGVKSVNGEDADREKESYALTLGGVNIVHKPGNL